MQLDVTPEALAAASGQVAALTARLIGANAAHTRDEDLSLLDTGYRRELTDGDDKPQGEL